MVEYIMKVKVIVLPSSEILLREGSQLFDLCHYGSKHLGLLLSFINRLLLRFHERHWFVYLNANASLYFPPPVRSTDVAEADYICRILAFRFSSSPFVRRQARLACLLVFCAHGHTREWQPPSECFKTE